MRLWRNVNFYYRTCYFISISGWVSFVSELSIEYVGKLSTKTGIDLSFFILLLLAIVFLGRITFTERKTRIKPQITTKAVFQELGKPKKGMRKIKIPRKNVDLRFIMMFYFILYQILLKVRVHGFEPWTPRVRKCETLSQDLSRSFSKE